MLYSHFVAQATHIAADATGRDFAFPPSDAIAFAY
jgi:hypothetical protein